MVMTLALAFPTLKPQNICQQLWTSSNIFRWCQGDQNCLSLAKCDQKWSSPEPFLLRVASIPPKVDPIASRDWLYPRFRDKTSFKLYIGLYSLNKKTWKKHRKDLNEITSLNKAYLYGLYGLKLQEEIVTVEFRVP